MPGDDLCDLMRRTNQEQPDLVAITGDLLMPFSEGNHSYLLEAISLLEAPVFVVPGNHDLPVADKLAGELRSLGCVWLADEQITIDVRGSRVEVVGLDFRWSGGESHMCRVMEACPPTSDTSFRLLLAHDPRMFRHVPPERFHLVLSGHTHGGQVGIDLSWLRWSVLGLLGVYDGDRFEDDSTVLYVHRGNWHTGWPPRMGIAGELAVIDVTPELA